MKMAENVQKFLDEASKKAGKYTEEVLASDCRSEFGDLRIKSPIEQILYTAIRVIQVFNRIPDADNPWLNSKDEWRVVGFLISPQRKISRYRVDFLVSYSFVKIGEQRTNQLIVECDSQAWHDRTEKERRYEKRRDRLLLSKGYKTYHYTGKEILEDPYKIAGEIVGTLVGYDVDVEGE